ncbi:Hsp33 family molecular chaperone HslO [Clostridium botulinum]|uniref:Hsp33 family molecular chaperone HslO n=1 Tax=Clostridium botulinum TaxID=1491 RepID=UPI0003065CA4|nr:Hsp33 family molecular chaperone HslO [Clostridium botulinum]KEH99527.1 heat shock protein Hsp33 [Clostridium botulinum D str. 16868]KLU75294.1 heat shock protein Hsp33 [Clostridium botulinum V891]KOA72711.1 heat shock protein Hsp33 [Clostridium botulinum]KOA90431.1 heat shock protein Hsp33 [Clostridium botulinum]MCD3203738.1 Hsp33 family molecular chaperone HslO [Clostridium botulinum C/D]
MSDKLIKATAKDGQVRIIAAVTKNLVNEGVKIHNCAPTAAAALGRMLTAGTLMGSMLKSNSDVVTIKIDGGGSAKGVTVTSYADAHVKGYIGNPSADLPPNSIGKLDVSGVIGKNGSLLVIRDFGLKEPYVGNVPIYTGEIGDDIAYYFTVSEQTPTAVGLGVLVDKDLSIKEAGGIIIQMMPGADEMLADLITYRLQDLGSITSFLSQGKYIYDMINFLFDDMDLKILEEIEPKYTCDCSRERIERALISIGKKDLNEIYEEGKSEEIVCHFCGEHYKFTHEQIGEILENLNK